MIPITSEKKITGRDHRERDVTEPLPRAGALDVRRLVQLRGTSSRPARKMIIVSPTPHRPSSTSPGFDVGGILEPQRRRQCSSARIWSIGPVPGFRMNTNAERRPRPAARGRQEEERAVEPDPTPGAREQPWRSADRERDRSGTPITMIHSVLRTRLPESSGPREHEAVVRQARPTRGGQQVVVGERVVEARDHRVEDEGAEPDDPRRHEQQHQAVVTGGAGAAAAAASGRRRASSSSLRGRRVASRYGVACCAAACRSAWRRPCRPGLRFGDLARLYLLGRYAANRSWSAVPIAVIGL